MVVWRLLAGRLSALERAFVSGQLKEEEVRPKPPLQVHQICGAWISIANVDSLDPRRAP